MSAGGPVSLPELEALSHPSHGVAQVTSALSLLAPKFRVRVEAAVAECRAKGLDARVQETLRSAALQELYYTRGRPPTAAYPHPVTNARSSLYSWHGYGLAVDVISERDGWFNVRPGAPTTERRARMLAGDAFFRGIATIFKAHGCDWGGDWKHPDPPHFQFGGLRASPSDRARALYAAGGVEAVWRVVGAL